MMEQKQIKAIRERTDQISEGHDICEDSWYSCPLSSEGCANENETECTCDQTVRAQAKADIDALLTEVTAAWSYIESHHLAARDVTEYEVNLAVAKAMRGIIGVHPEVCTRVFAAIEPMFSAYRNARMEVERIGSALGRTERHQLSDCGCGHDGAQHETVLVCPSCMPTFAVVRT